MSDSLSSQSFTKTVKHQKSLLNSGLALSYTYTEDNEGDLGSTGGKVDRFSFNIALIL
jgi:hypothetical protein